MSGLLGDTGPIDYDALVIIRDIFLDTEPLVSESHLSDRLDPRPELQITLEEGFKQSSEKSVRYRLDGSKLLPLPLYRTRRNRISL